MVGSKCIQNNMSCDSSTEKEKDTSTSSNELTANNLKKLKNYENDPNGGSVGDQNIQTEDNSPLDEYRAKMKTEFADMHKGIIQMENCVAEKVRRLVISVADSDKSIREEQTRIQQTENNIREQRILIEETDNSIRELQIRIGETNNEIREQFRQVQQWINEIKQQIR